MIKGSVKVGRWTYPATLSSKTLAGARSEFRDGSGEQVAFAADDKISTTFVSEDYSDAREILRQVFDLFAASSDEIHVGALTEKRVNEVARALVELGILTREQRPTDVGGKEWIYQSWKTYDDHQVEEVLADFDAKVDPRTFAVTSRKETKPVNNTHAKPGRSDWSLGSPCAQGLHVLTEDSRYEMPSGRVQCRDCRRGYASNI